MLRPLVPVSVIMATACAQSTDPAPKPPMTFDDCLITHMAAIDMLEGAISEKDAFLCAAVITSQTDLLNDDTMDDDDLAQRTSTLMQSYSPAADDAITETKAIGAPPIAIAAQALLCGQELAQ